MSKVTSKLQITVPKAVAEMYGIRPGDEVDWVPAGDAVRLVPLGRQKPAKSLKERLALFDQATERQRQREAVEEARAPETGGRGWTRDELYDRG